MNKYKFSLYVIIGLLILSCSIAINPRIETSSIESIYTQTNDRMDTSISPTLTFPFSIKSTETTMNITQTTTEDSYFNFIKLKSLPSGRYIVYSIKKEGNIFYQYIVSESGKEMGLLSIAPPIQFISPNQKYIAYIEHNKLFLFDIENNKKITVKIDKEVFPSGEYISWDPTNEIIAIAEYMSISLINIADGKKIREISNVIDPKWKSTYSFYSPEWSPNNKWIAFYILVDQMIDTPSPGPYISEITCMENPTECYKKTRLVTNAPGQLLDWTPSNKLAVFDKYDYIRVYDIESSSLVKEIQLPDGIGYSEFFSWSNDEEWIAFGGECGVCILSIETREVRVLIEEEFIIDYWYIVP